MLTNGCYLIGSFKNETNEQTNERTNERTNKQTDRSIMKYIYLHHLHGFVYPFIDVETLPCSTYGRIT